MSPAKNTLVLGVGGFMHDYNCCLIDVGGKRVAMAEAERLSRIKHHVVKADDKDVMAPIVKCCEDLGVKPRHIDTVVFGHTDPFPIKDRLRQELGDKNFVEVDHHLCHAAGAFFASPYNAALIVSVDGFGDGAAALMAQGEGTRIEELERVPDRDSIGLEYLRATYHLGLGGYGAEGKTQGLASYGEPVWFERYMNEIEITPEGGVCLSDKLQGPSSDLAVEGGYLNTQLLTNAFLDDLCRRRIAPEPLTQDHHNVAASIQKVLEHVVVEQCLIGKKRTGLDTLVLGGGVTMNSSLNGELLRGGAFSRIFPLPMASDRGIGLGAALYHVHHDLGVPRFFRLDHIFYGGAFDDRAALRALKKAGLEAARSDDVVGAAAEVLARGGIVGWVQGRSEMGARALGHRSILADPRTAAMKDTVNARVKHRESFRPFAPAVLEERAAEYFHFPDDVADLSFMTFTAEATEKAIERVPAVVHADNTARLQVVRRQTDPLYAAVIERFADLTGEAVLLNTSFNDAGEPIVETPAEAVRTFLKADMDLLCVGNVVATRK